MDGKLEKSDSISADEISHLAIDIGGNFFFICCFSFNFFCLFVCVCEREILILVWEFGKLLAFLFLVVSLRGFKDHFILY